MAQFTSADSSGLIVYTTVTIANGTSLSPAVDLDKYSLIGINMPSGWTTANLSFQVAHDNSTFNPLNDKTGEIDLASAAASVYIALDPTVFVGLRFIKLRSGTNATPVNQGADRVITLILRAL